MRAEIGGSYSQIRIFGEKELYVIDSDIIASMSLILTHIKLIYRKTPLKQLH